ncbi:fasciclin domain-containing protein [Pontibacter toksunensis]|uniref:Fasciclin domain-containing protein n=1 Tax=Pontibacter toksunensis TaxID=1332631 RepID=A0ABW6BY86_9BACT
MKKRTIIPTAFAAIMLFGCAGSNDTMNDTTAMDTSTTMSETQSMAGTAADATTTTDAGTVKALIIEREIVAPIATIAVAALPMENPVELDEMYEDVADTEQFNVMDLARKSPNLSTFVKLIEYADLVQDINRLNEATLFAPTNEAFAKMDRQKLEMLLMPENKAQLMQVLQAHVLPSKVSSLQFNTTQRIQLTEDRYIPIDVTMNGTNVVVGGASIVKNNIEASNGFIHVVDSVILPDQVAVEGGAGIGY